MPLTTRLERVHAQPLRWAGLGAALLLNLSVLPPAQAEAAADYPSKAVRVVVPYPPGGPNDLLARIVAQKVGEKLGQTLVIDNRPGATGLTGSDQVAKSPADGYTLLVSASVHVIYPSLFSKVPFDPLKDFAPVSLLARAPLVMSVNPGVQAKDVQGLIALAKTSDLQYASSGNGSATHLAAEAFKKQAGVALLHITYKGSAPAMNDVIAGHVQVIFDSVPSSKPFIESGKLRPLAVTSAKRSVALPDVPSMAEGGLPNYDLSTWYGLWAPAGTPPAIAEKLARTVREVLQAADTRARLAQLGIEPEGKGPAEFAAFQAAEAIQWAQLVKDSGAKLD